MFVCTYVCVTLCVSVCLHMYLCVFPHVCVSVCVSSCLHMCVSVCVCLCMRVSVCVCVHIITLLCVCVCVCVCVCMCVCVWSLPELLLSPLWRLEEYITLLQALSLTTPPDHPDHAPLAHALVAMTRLREFIRKVTNQSPANATHQSQQSNGKAPIAAQERERERESIRHTNKYTLVETHTITTHKHTYTCGDTKLQHIHTHTHNRCWDTDKQHTHSTWKHIKLQSQPTNQSPPITSLQSQRTTIWSTLSLPQMKSSSERDRLMEETQREIKGCPVRLYSGLSLSLSLSLTIVSLSLSFFLSFFLS
jgi:hypothetical protein